MGAEVGLAPGVAGSEGVDGSAPVGVGDSAVVAVEVSGGVSAGLVPPGLGLPSPGVGLRSSDVGEAKAVAVELGVGVAVGACATGTAAPTTVSRAAATQMIWPRRRKLATMRRLSATMERDYRPGAVAVELPSSEGWYELYDELACSRGRLDPGPRDTGTAGRAALLPCLVQRT